MRIIVGELPNNSLGYLVMAPNGAEARAPDSRTGARALQRSSKLGNKLDEVTSS